MPAPRRARRPSRRAAAARPEACCAPAAARPLPAPAASTVPVLRALAEPARLWIVRRLAGAPGPVCVCDLVGELGLGQPTVSHHLAVLRRAGLVSSFQRGRWSYYRFEPAGLGELQAELERLGLAAAATRVRGGRA